ncbi:hypothetical protein [Peribacillus huizhouensis]|uniref:Uncharacterized protein n=1 Tax=Peribacillus huizhouensis TaxID=1501239 RepID=A0ABR6CRK2_9BACI|nr:hypothetical protein [Peribacillus huizhouensis]MBA9027579.1 hypothetical protein [Peribacillus huizhouensis]
MREFTTVKRKANVGERILITEAWLAGGYYRKGDVLTVKEIEGNVVLTEGNALWISDSEYEVIIENRTESEAVGMKITEDYCETLAFTENEDGTFSLNFKKIPALVHVSYDGNGTHDQTFLHGEYKAEAQRIKIESAVGELTTYTIDSIAALKPVESKAAVQAGETVITRTEAEAIGKLAVRTPQEIRDEIVAKAKRDVAEIIHANQFTADDLEIIVNKEKRTVVALMKYLRSGKVFDKGIAKACPTDCFNVHIGKAIAVRRALGLEVPADYLNTPQPTEVRVGDVVAGRRDESYYATTKRFTLTAKCSENPDAFKYAERPTDYIYRSQIGKIIDDSRE